LHALELSWLGSGTDGPAPGREIAEFSRARAHVTSVPD
jgi:hypothetical protein